MRSVRHADQLQEGQSHALSNWSLILLALGAMLGIAAAAVVLARRDRAQAEDPDAPLFI